MRIVIVEDDADLLAELAQFLARRRHGVEMATSVVAARRMLEDMSPPPDAVLSNVILNDGSGVDLCREMAARLPRCRWVLMSGAPDLLAAEQALANIPRSTWVLLTKPMAMPEMLRAIERPTADRTRDQPT